MQGCLKKEDITCKVRKQEYEENKEEGEMSETKEEGNKIAISTKNANMVINYRYIGRIRESISCGSFEYCNRVEDVVAKIS